MDWLTTVYNWFHDHPELSTGLLSSFIVFIASIVAIFTLRSMRKERASTIALNLNQSYDTGVLLKARILIRSIRNYQEKEKIIDKSENFLKTIEYYEEEDPEQYMYLTSIPGFFDLVGWLVRRGCCNLHEVDALLDWEEHFITFESYIRKYQKKSIPQKLDDSPTAFYGNFIWLVRKMGRSC